jgi:gentisate 1,2-dioxygenase
MTELLLLGHGQFFQSKLQQIFGERVQEQTLRPLLPVIQGLMRFKPSERISASWVLELLRPKTDEAKSVKANNETDVVYLENNTH